MSTQYEEDPVRIHTDKIQGLHGTELYVDILSDGSVCIDETPESSQEWGCGVLGARAVARLRRLLDEDRIASVLAKYRKEIRRDG